MKKNLLKRMIAVIMLLTMLTVAFAAHAETSGASLKKGDTIVTTRKTKMMAYPDPNDYALTKVPAKKTLTLVAGSQRDYLGVAWYKVKYNGNTGWISSDFCRTESGKGGKGSEKTLCPVTTGKVNIRAASSIESKTQGTAPKGAILKDMNAHNIDERGVTWYKIRYNGVTGWVSEKYLTWKMV